MLLKRNAVLKLCFLTPEWCQTTTSADSAADFWSGVLGNLVGEDWKFGRGDWKFGRGRIRHLVERFEKSRWETSEISSEDWRPRPQRGYGKGRQGQSQGQKQDPSRGWGWGQGSLSVGQLALTFRAFLGRRSRDPPLPHANFYIS